MQSGHDNFLALRLIIHTFLFLFAFQCLPDRSYSKRQEFKTYCKDVRPNNRKVYSTENWFILPWAVFSVFHLIDSFSILKIPS